VPLGQRRTWRTATHPWVSGWGLVGRTGRDRVGSPCQVPPTRSLRTMSDQDLELRLRAIAVYRDLAAGGCPAEARDLRSADAEAVDMDMLGAVLAIGTLTLEGWARLLERPAADVLDELAVRLITAQSPETVDLGLFEES